MQCSSEANENLPHEKLHVREKRNFYPTKITRYTVSTLDLSHTPHVHVMLKFVQVQVQDGWYLLLIHLGVLKLPIYICPTHNLHQY